MEGSCIKKTIDVDENLLADELEAPKILLLSNNIKPMLCLNTWL